MTFFIYSRKSVYSGKGESIENQIAMCKQYIYAKYPKESDSDIYVYEDEGFSAKNVNRPQLQKMLADIRLIKPDFIVCYRLDRISRNVSDFSSFIEDLNRRNISFVCIKEEFDTSKPMGKAMMYIASVFAQLERETIAERVRDNMLMLARTGRWLGGTTPTGYASEKRSEIIIDGKIRYYCSLKENPSELATVKTIYEKFLELQSISGVSKYLISQGIKSRKNKFFSAIGVKQILQNPVYCTADTDALAFFTENCADVCFEEKDCYGSYGLLSYNKRDYKTKSAPRRSIDKWIIATGKHKGLISGEKWASVQNIIKNNAANGKTPSAIHSGLSLLSGLIYCKCCGRRMFSKRRGGKNADPNAYDYICSGKLRGGASCCRCQNINGRQADSMVCMSIMELIYESPAIYRLLDKLKLDLIRSYKNEAEFSIEAQIQKLYAETDNLINSLASENLSPAFIQNVNSKISRLDSEISELNIKLNSQQNAPDAELPPSLLADTLSSLKYSMDNLSIYEKRTLIKLLINKILWDGVDFHIFVKER